MAVKLSWADDLRAVETCA